MTGYAAYKLYFPLKIHFSYIKYNVLNSQRIKGLTFSNYSSRKDTHIFESLGKKFKEPREYIRFCVANFAYNNSQFLYNLDNTAFENLKTWEKVRQSITNVFSNDLSIIDNFDTDNIINLYLNSEVHIETICILYSIGKINIEESFLDHLIYGNDFLRILKTTPFVKFDRAKINFTLNSI